MEITIIETSAYLELKRQLSMLPCSWAISRGSVSGITGEVVGRQEVCMALGISKRCLQNHRDRG